MPIGLPPGTYQLRLRAIDSGTGLALTFDKNAADGYLGLGPLVVTRPTQPWPRSALTEGTSVNATWLNAIDLWAWTVPPGPLRPNVTLPLDLIWHARTDLQQGYHFKLQIRTPSGGTLQTIESELSSQDQSAATWRAGDVMRQSLLVILPAEAHGGDYHVWLQVAEAGAPLDSSPIDLGALKVEEYPLVTTAPAVTIERPAQFEQDITLLGANLSQPPYLLGGQLEVSLVWRAGQEPDDNYTVFVQLWKTDKSTVGNPAGQGDSDPVDGLRPTRSWRPGEIIVDGHHVPLKPDLPPGEYTVYVGLYQRDTGARLAVTVDGASSPERWVKLTTVKLEQP